MNLPGSSLHLLATLARGPLSSVQMCSRLGRCQDKGSTIVPAVDGHMMRRNAQKKVATNPMPLAGHVAEEELSDERRVAAI